jgi:adenylate cyclase
MQSLPDLAARLLSPVSRLGVRPEDPETVRLQKALLVGGTLFILPVAVIWALLYFVFGEPLAGSVTTVYAALSVSTLIYLAATGRDGPASAVQLLCTLVLPYFLTVILGGFMNASGVMLGALMAPLGSLLYANARRASLWFAGYAVLTLLVGLLDPFIRHPNNLPEWLITTLFVLNVLIVSTLAFSMLYSFVHQKQMALELLRLEQERSERLLLNVLPQKIAGILKNEARTIAERFDAVTILFADIANFTELSAEMDPVELVELLNEVYSYFDSLIEQYGLEKIRTIGDSYMVVSGVPTPRPDHAQVMARAALEMLSAPDNHPIRQLQLRLGMNSGPVVAGVIGKQRFHYDAWGDSVNVASRMQTHGEPGKIQITRATYELVKDDFICEPRGRIYVKGKGLMETWFLLAAKEPGSPAG